MVQRTSILAVGLTLLMLGSMIPTAAVSLQDASATEASFSPDSQVDSSPGLPAPTDPIASNNSSESSNNSSESSNNSSESSDNSSASRPTSDSVSKSPVDLRNYDSNAVSTDSTSDERVRLVFTLSRDNASRISAMRSMGASIEAQSGDRVQAKIRLSRLADYRSKAWIEQVRRPRIATPTVVSEGVNAINASVVHQRGITGQNVKVGVLAATGFDTTNSEIASNIQTAQSFRSSGLQNGGQNRHGTAVAEIVVDTAPDSELYLANFRTSVEYQNAVQWMRSQDVDVIVMSVSFFNQPYDGTGSISQTADNAVQDGIVWVNSAGNYRESHWQGTYQDPDGDAWLNYSSSTEINWLNNNNSLSAGELVRVDLTWDDWNQTDQDYDLYLVDEAGNIIARSDRAQDGDDAPTEYINTRVPSSGIYGIAVRLHNASGTHQLELFSVDHDFSTTVAGSSVTAPAAGDQTISVGAFHHSGQQMRSYSSEGPTNDGDVGVNVVGPDGVSTSAYSGSFPGTSAAAPHVAGAATLLKAKNSSLSPRAIQETLEQTATDAATAGFDSYAGHGIVNTDSAEQSVSAGSSSNSSSSNSTSSGLNVTVTQVKDSSFATIEAFVSVENASRSSTTGLVAPNLVTGLTEQNFNVTENGTSPGQISVRRVGTSGSDISTALVIDRSGSMAGTPLSEAKSAAKQFVGNFGTGDEGAVISFADQSRINQRWTRDTTKLKTAIDSLTAGGGTALYDSTARAIREADGRQGRSAVIVLTDGRDTASVSETRQSVINLAQQRGITVYTIGLGGARQAPLQEIAQQTGGTFYSAPTASNLSSIYQDISQQLRDEYKVTYSSPRPQADGTKRIVDVSVSTAGKSGADTGQYTAPQSQVPNASYTFSRNGLTVSYNASQSFDPDGSVTGYFWDFDNDGLVDDTGETVTHTFPSNGTYQTKLTVQDNSSVNGSVIKSIKVPPATAGGLNVSITQVKDSSFATIEAFVSIENASRSSTTGLVAPNLVTGLTEQNFNVTENGTSPGQISVRRVGAGGADISTALVIDRSGSMAGTPLSEAKSAAKQFVGNFGTGDEGAVFSFASQSRIDQRWTRDQTELKAAIDSLRAGGVTALYESTARAIREADGRQGRSAVIVLTDGRDNSSPTETKQSVINLAQQRGITVYTIGLGGARQAPLREMAQQTGGTFYSAPTASDLNSIYQDISQQLQDEYKVTYSSPRPQADGTKRIVDVSVTAAGKSGSDTGQYTAPQSKPPDASFTYTQNGLTITYNASNATDPDGSITGYFWDFDNNGVVDARGQTATHTFPSNGTYQTKLTVQDNDSVNATEVKSILVSRQSGPSTTAKVVLEGAPNGLKRYDVSLNSTTGVSVANFEGGQLTVSRVGGGTGQDYVRVIAADLTNNIGPTNSDIVLLKVAFAGNVTKQTLQETIYVLIDDGDKSIQRNRVSLRVSSGKQGQLFSSTLPGSRGQGPPQDPDGDGTYEDINGDGNVTFDDAVSLAFVDDSQLSQAQIDAIDRDGDGDIDFDDAIDLAFDPLVT